MPSLTSILTGVLCVGAALCTSPVPAAAAPLAAPSPLWLAQETVTINRGLTLPPDLVPSKLDLRQPAPVSSPAPRAGQRVAGAIALFS